jgi:hypothetical protein
MNVRGFTCIQNVPVEVFIFFSDVTPWSDIAVYRIVCSSLLCDQTAEVQYCGYTVITSDRELIHVYY